MSIIIMSPVIKNLTVHTFHDRTIKRDTRYTIKDANYPIKCVPTAHFQPGPISRMGSNRYLEPLTLLVAPQSGLYTTISVNKLLKN